MERSTAKRPRYSFGVLPRSSGKDNQRIGRGEVGKADKHSGHEPPSKRREMRYNYLIAAWWLPVNKVRLKNVQRQSWSDVYPMPSSSYAIAAASARQTLKCIPIIHRIVKNPKMKMKTKHAWS